MVKDLITAGWTQVALAEQCRCDQTMISRMKSGEYKDATYSIGRRLEYLWANKVAPPATAGTR